MGGFCRFLFLIVISAGVMDAVTASFDDEMAALEKDIANDEKPLILKKSIKDLTTDELIAELERDLKKTSPEKRESSAEKYRKRFLDLIEKKGAVEDMEFSKTMSGAELYTDVVNAMYADFEDVSDEKKDESETTTKEKRGEGHIAGACVDLRTDCKFLKSFCYTHSEKLKVSCAKTCKFCAECKQRVPAKTCEVLKGRKLCNSPNPATRNRMIKLCPITCGFCNVPSPPKCSDTEWGCCWDKLTTKTEQHGRNCPPCINRYRYVCKTFLPDCKSFLRPGEFMRQNCPQACGLCKGKCADDRDKVALCKFWKKDLNFCEEKKDVMKWYCPTTCGFC